MPIEQDQTDQTSVPARLRAGWAAAGQSYRRLNDASHHLLGFTLKLLLVGYFLFGIALLGLRYVVMPQIADYRADVEQFASKAIGRPVTIGELSGGWQKLRPSLQLENVTIYGQDDEPALRLPRVSAVISWWSVPAFDLRLHRLDIDRPDLEIERDAQGHFYVAGMLVKTGEETDGRAGDWVLSQHDIHINQGRLRWKDGLRQAPELQLEQVDIVLQNSGTRHRFALKATPPASIAAPLDVRARFEHSRFGGRKSDPLLWTGEIYADVRDTDLATWKTYLDFPVDLRAATGSLRAWLAFDHARVANLTADLALSNVVVKLRKDQEPLELVSANGRVSVQETIDSQVRDGNPTFGLNGHAVAVTDLTVQTRDGLILPKTTMSERYVAAKGSTPERTEVQVQMLDLQALAQLAERLPLPPAQLRMLRDFAPRGSLHNFSAQWQGAYPDIQSYQVKGDFLNLGLAPQVARAARAATAKVPAQAAVPAIPGFENLSGHIDASDKGGAFQLASKQVRFVSPAYFAEPTIGFDTLDADAKWKFEKNDMLLLTLRNLSFAKDALHVALAGTHLMPIDKQAKAEPGVIDLNGTVSGLELDRVGNYLPLGMPDDVREWLTHGLVGGTLQDGRLRLKGDLARFPFHEDKPTDKNRGEFVFAGKIHDGVLNYAPDMHAPDGKSPMWPLLEKIQGSILFDKARLEVHGDTGETHGAQVANVKAVVPDLMSHESVLQIDGTASGPLQRLLRYTVDSPVGEWIGHFTDESSGTGNATLALKLDLPLHDMHHAKVNGTLKFANNGVTLMRDMPEIAQTNGRLEFDEKGVTLHNIKGNFLGGPLTIGGGTQKDGTIQVRADGTLTVAGLRKAYPAAQAQKLIDRVNGSTRFTTLVAVRGKAVDVTVESNLRGLGLDFPAPLHKDARDALPLRFVQSGGAVENGTMSRDTIRVNLGNVIAANYQRERVPGPNGASWRVARGGIGINAAPPEPNSGLQANVNVPALNIDDWIKATSSITSTAASKSATQTSSGPELGQYVETDKLALRTDELFVLGKRFDSVVAGLTHADDLWQVNIESSQMTGHLNWRDSGSGRGLGRITARLTSLKIPKTAGADVKDMLSQVDQDTEMPALDIVADNFELYGKKLGRLELLAHYVRATGGREWRIRNLTVSNPDARLSATGNWLVRNGTSTSSLDYKLEMEDAGKLLARFGFPDVLKDGAGSLTGDISWNGMPFAIDYPSLSGKIALDVKKGQFLKVEPGAAKLLGVLSMQSLPRRLTLDFRDVFSEGFAFDGINGNAQISKGLARTDNLKMRGVAATVLIDGAADIVKETQDLRAVVVPEINAGAASVAYALAVNPVIGAGTFLAQLFLRAPLARAFTYEYAITGSWSDPSVNKIERKIEPAPNSAINKKLYEG
ncbi:YhdP family protein [uncultured Oxalicibacterium sp.]|uniref:YhdP family protein n=1 Tax=uncultured Oxalicibacterium sp. TaxID=1168540 RepID=UPI0025F1E490|nr:YhdP family protein [uncultured Oxalicibacterium sp.]